MHEIADFRSDTVTQPTTAMWDAMNDAVLGDDVLGHDPTTQALEEEGARVLGKEAALFMPSGTMCNLVDLMTHCRPGDEVVLEEWAHTARFEGGGAGALAHVQVRTVRSDRGQMDPKELAVWVSPGSEHTPRTSLVSVEQTHNFHGGTVMSQEGLAAIADLCREREVVLHLDGARLWNAEAASGVPAATHAAHADTVSVCLSKGLCAPVGSLLAGSADFIQRARFNRKRVGGGMRQSGIMAAAGLVALKEMRERLTEDHAQARLIAETLAETDGYDVDAEGVQTNIVFVRCQRKAAAEIVETAAQANVLLYATAADQIRFVTHNDVDDDDVDCLLGLLVGLAG